MSWLMWWLLLLLLVIVLAVVIVVGVSYRRHLAKRGLAHGSSSSSNLCSPSSTSDRQSSVLSSVFSSPQLPQLQSITLATATLTTHQGVVVPQSYIIVLKDSVADVKSVSALISANVASVLDGITNNMIIGQQYEHSIRGFAAANITVDMLNQLLRHPAISSIHEDGVIALSPVGGPTPAPNTQVVPWGPVRIGAPASSLRVGGGSGGMANVEIYIIDTGVQLDHPDLRLGSSGVTFVPGTSSAYDQNGHGTHVSGIAAAVDNAYGMVGTCPGAKIMPVRVLDASGKGQFSWVIAGVNYVQSVKATTPSRLMVANMSLAASVGTTTYNILDVAVGNAIAAGVPFTIAAGNSCSNANTFSPAHVTTAITVAAINQNNTFASFSNWGPNVTVDAPGNNILSTYLNSTYVYLSGTSMAAPMVTGIVALYLTENPTATPAQIKSAIINASLPSTTNPPVSQTPPNTTNLCAWQASF